MHNIYFEIGTAFRTDDCNKDMQTTCDREKLDEGEATMAS